MHEQNPRSINTNTTQGKENEEYHKMNTNRVTSKIDFKAINKGCIIKYDFACALEHWANN